MFYLHNHGKFQGGRNHAMISIVMISSTLAPQSLLETAARVIREVLNLMLTFLDLQSSQAHLTSLRVKSQSLHWACMTWPAAPSLSCHLQIPGPLSDPLGPISESQGRRAVESAF